MALCDLRFKLLGLNDEMNSRKMWRKGRKIEWDPRDVTEDMLEHVCVLIGRAVRQVTIRDDFRKMDRMAHIAQLLGNLQFTHLEVRMINLMDESL